MSTPYAPTKTVLIDFDGTIMPFSWPGLIADPFPGAVDAINTLYDEGYHVVIFSARFWSGWNKTDSADDHTYTAKRTVKAYLAKHGIRYSELSAEKRPCLFILDDSAIKGGGDIGAAPWSVIVDEARRLRVKQEKFAANLTREA